MALVKGSVSTKETLLAAARAVFGAHGYDGAAVDTILAVAGVSAPTMYHHFGSKAGLYCAAADRAFADIFARTRRHGDGDKTGAQRIQAIFRTGQEFARDDPAIVPLIHYIQIDVVRRPELAAARDGYAPIWSWIKAAVREGIADGSLTSQSSPKALADLVATLVAGLSTEAMARPTHFRQQSQELIDAFEPGGVFAGRS